MPDPERHPVYKALYRAPKKWGVEYRHLGIGPCVGLAVAWATATTLGPVALGLGLTLAVSCHLFSRWATGRDPQIVQILWQAARMPPRYDPGKCVATAFEVRS